MSELHSIVRVDQGRPSRLYLPQLDTMRFFAFLSVFFFHSLPANDMRTHTGAAKTVALVEATVHRSFENGVGLFFLLSAYLITELLRREKDLTGSIHLLRFYFRRSLRIWPLYYLAVAIGLLLRELSPVFYIPPKGILAYLFFWKNWDLALHGPTWNPIYVLWTVSAEEQFYAVWPVAQKFLKKRAMIVGCAFLVLALPCIAFWPSGFFFRTYNSQIVYLFLYFPAGALLAYSLQGRRQHASIKWCLLLVVSGVLLWIGGTFLSYPGGEMPEGFSLFVTGRAVIVAGTIMVFLGFYWSAPAWSPKVLIYLGRISYGLYVFHVMALLLAIRACQAMGFLVGKSSFSGLAAGLALKMTIGFAITVAISIVSYEYFEKRFLGLKDRLAFIHSRPAGEVSRPAPGREVDEPESKSLQETTQR